MPHGNQQLAVEHARAIGGDQLSLSVGVLARLGAAPHISSGGSAGLALLLGSQTAGLDASLAFSQHARTLLGVDGTAVLLGSAPAAILGQRDQGADAGPGGTRARAAGLPDVAGIAGVVVRSALAPIVPRIESEIAVRVAQDIGHLDPHITALDASNERQHALRCLQRDGVAVHF